MRDRPLCRPIRNRPLGRAWLALALALGCVSALSAPLTAGADPEAQALLSPALLEAAQAKPDSVFNVIVQGEQSSGTVAAEVRSAVAAQSSASLSGAGLAHEAAAAVERRFVTVPGVAATLTGSQLVALAQSSEPLVITLDTPVTVADEPTETEPPPPPQPTAEGPVSTPANTEEPAVSGEAEPGRLLTATPGVWSGGGLTYSYRWQRCDSRFRAAAILADSPIGYWRLGESEGKAVRDASGHSLEGVYSGAISYGIAGVTGDSDTGVALAGAGTVEVPGIGGNPFASGFALEAWVKVAAPQADRALIARWLQLDPRIIPIRDWEENLGFLLQLDSDGNYGLAAGRYAPSYVQTSVAPTVGEWEHIVGSWDGSTLRLFRNGHQIGSEDFSGPLGDPAVNLTIGTHALASESLDGAVDEVAVYDHPLSAREVRGHHAGCEDIPGETDAGYSPIAQDLGLRLRASVTASNEVGSSTSASALTQLVTARPPVQTSEVGILGTAEDDQTLNAAHGSWDGTQPFSFAHQWQRCDADGASCTDIAGADKPSYKLGPDDVGTTVRLLLTARNLGGETSARSEPSDSVVAVPERLPRFKQHWPYVAGVASLLAGSAPQAEPPTIAIVDSGIDADRADFDGRVIEQVTRTEREPNTPGDGNGHGTAVASLAAGEAEGYTGAAPDAKLVSIDVLDDTGVANTSDVIEAADWIYENKERLNIRVANFSLHGTNLASLASDPLDKAVERLWLSGIVVVAAAGNYAANGEESAVPFAPGNDPFVLTVGATDTGGSFTKRDDVAAPWSAWGYTRDGFAKPELVAPGRYIAAAVSSSAKLARDRPDRIVEPGYLQLSGTSLAAPVVAGSAATILGAHPEWSPDQVKGALMLTAEPLSRAAPRSVGVGALNAAGAAAVIDPPNPNLALNQFVVPDPEGGQTPVFNAPAWTQVVATDPAWASVAWGSVAWGSAAWSSVAWGSVAWGSVAWGSVAWGSVAWGSVAWGSVAWGSHARDDVHPGGGYWVRRN